MKCTIILLLLMVVCVAGFAQEHSKRKDNYNPQPSDRTRFFDSKISTFPVKNGDILLYKVRTDSGQHQLVVTINRFDTAVGFTFRIPEKEHFGSVLIPPSSWRNATKYDSTFTPGETVLNNKSVLWLSKRAYASLYWLKETVIDLGGGIDTFQRESVGTYKINYKGKEKVITYFNVQGKRGQSFSVLNDVRNPLMVRLNNSEELVLKEVR